MAGLGDGLEALTNFDTWACVFGFGLITDFLVAVVVSLSIDGCNWSRACLAGMLIVL